MEEEIGKRTLDGRSNRKKRIPLGVTRKSLSVPDNLMDKNYVYRWMNDSQDKPNRLKEAQDGGYTFVHDPDIEANVGDKVENPKGLDSRISQYAGSNRDGTPYRCYLMRIKRTWYDEDQAEKQKPLDELEAALKIGTDEQGGPGEEGRYIPREGISIGRGKV
jgi:hypothetical protein